MPNFDPYQVLGITPDATQEEIRSKYRQLARLYHPDLNSSPDAGEIFYQITESYRLISELNAQPNAQRRLKRESKIPVYATRILREFRGQLSRATSKWRRPKASRRSSDDSATLDPIKVVFITFEQAISGSIRNLKLERKHTGTGLTVADGTVIAREVAGRASYLQVKIKPSILGEIKDIVIFDIYLNVEEARRENLIFVPTFNGDFVIPEEVLFPPYCEGLMALNVDSNQFSAVKFDGNNSYPFLYRINLTFSRGEVARRPMERFLYTYCLNHYDKVRKKSA